jgi:streptomycin 6-kinase
VPNEHPRVGHASHVGARARADFLSALPGLIAELTRKWQLELGEVFPNPSSGYVARAWRRGESLVLKVSVPHDEWKNELQALEAFAGRGGVGLVDADLARSALLLEGAQPGGTLATLDDDDRAMGIAAELLTKLWQPAPPVHPFRNVSDWGAALHVFRERPHPGLEPDLLDRAAGIFAKRLADSSERTLLHGDFHQFNVLDAGERGWLFIDPKGAVGSRGYDLGPLLRNLLFDCDDPARRLAAELALAEEAVLGWGFSGAVLSAAWFLEDGLPGSTEAVACARLMGEALA